MYTSYMDKRSSKEQQEAAANLSGKALAKVFRYMDNETLKAYADRGSKAAKREVKRRFDLGDYV
jgi:hypothetical protein